MKAAFFQGEPQTMRLVSTFSLQQALARAAADLELFVIPGEERRRAAGGQRDSLHRPDGGRTALSGDDAGCGTGPAGSAIRPGDRGAEFVRAGGQAGLLPVLVPGSGDGARSGPAIWTAHWVKAGWPLAVRIEMAPLEPDPSRLQPITVVAPIYIRRAVDGDAMRITDTTGARGRGPGAGLPRAAARCWRCCGSPRRWRRSASRWPPRCAAKPTALRPKSTACAATTWPRGRSTAPISSCCGPSTCRASGRFRRAPRTSITVSQRQRAGGDHSRGRQAGRQLTSGGGPVPAGDGAGDRTRTGAEIAAAIDDWRRPVAEGSLFDPYYLSLTPSFRAPPCVHTRDRGIASRERRLRPIFSTERTSPPRTARGREGRAWCRAAG